MPKKLLAVLVLLYACVGLQAQENFAFTRLDINRGLSHNQINSILQDDKGFMWFGTEAGLNRFDGYSFKVFKSKLHDTTSLNENIIHQLWQLPEGRMGVLTRDGTICVYNPITETFQRDADAYFKSLGLPNAAIKEILRDKKGNYWFVHQYLGVFKYTTSDKSVKLFTNDSRSNAFSISSNSIVAAALDNNDGLWIINKDAVLEKISITANKVVYRSDALRKQLTNNININTNHALFVDKDNELWIQLGPPAVGIYYFKPQNGGTIEHLSKTTGFVHLNNDLVKCIVQDNKERIWLGTDHGGINVIDKKKKTIRYVLTNDEDAKSLSQNVIISMFKDNTGIMWIGTYKKGINYFHENVLKFPLYKHLVSQPGSLQYDDVNRFVEDASGNLWIGTNGGGLIYFNKTTGKFAQYLHSESNSNSLSNDVIVSLCVDHKQRLWIGTYNGGLDCFDGKTFTHYKNNPQNENSLVNNNVWALHEDANKQLWIGTLGGLDILDMEKSTFKHFKSNNQSSIRSDNVFAITETRNGDIWIGTTKGINVLEKNAKQFIHYEHNPKVNSSLSNDNVLDILEDSKGRIWICTYDGLNLFDKRSKSFRVFRAEDGLADNNALRVLEDNLHHLWVSTPNGISNIVVNGAIRNQEVVVQFKNYDEADGLQSRAFNQNAAYKTRNGTLVFGGANGFNMFNPQNIMSIKDVSPVVLTDFQLFNKSIAIGEAINSRVILNQAINETKELVLKYNQNIFSIEFAALTYDNPEKKKYAYRLEGFNKDWLVTDGKLRRATYTNLDPGKYTFRVKTADDEGVWSKEDVQLVVYISPPFWKTGFAYFFYVLLVLAVLYFSRKFLLDRANERFAIAQERQVAQHMHEMDLMKIKFFTNVSHEFRTPLSLIITPLDKIVDNTADPSQKGQLQMVHRNARRLLNLVNQLLDFRKLETHELKLMLTKGDFIEFCKEVCFSFTDMAEKKEISFTFKSELPSFFTQFDNDKIERILFNLLSNAFKFTPAFGKIEVTIGISNHQLAPHHTHLLQIKVKDSGIGIPKEKQEKIFERFFQTEMPGSIVNQGSGIGLSITKEFVKLHNGNIYVESEVNQGSTFVVNIPFALLDQVAAAIPPTEVVAAVIEGQAVDVPEQTTATEAFDNYAEVNAVELDKSKELIQKKGRQKPVLLLIEDNEDFRFYLKDNLKEFYVVLEAGNGKEGWQKALQQHPHLIVSDINMPEMNGIDLCKKIKADPRTAHIPVILLTARSAEEHLIEGYGIGANDYITKPFNFELLQARIHNLVVTNENLRKQFQKQVGVSTQEIKIESQDEKLMQQILKIIEKNIDNPDFSVEELSRDVFMSRVGLYKKVFALTGKTPIELIRAVRIERAAQLLQKSKLTVAEVAYEVGFNNPKYFAKYFKAAYGVLPSAYVANIKNEQAATDASDEL